MIYSEVIGEKGYYLEFENPWNIAAQPILQLIEPEDLDELIPGETIELILMLEAIQHPDTCAQSSLFQGERCPLVVELRARRQKRLCNLWPQVGAATRPAPSHFTQVPGSVSQ